MTDRRFIVTWYDGHDFPFAYTVNGTEKDVGKFIGETMEDYSIDDIDSFRVYEVSRQFEVESKIEVKETQVVNVR